MSNRLLFILILAVSFLTSCFMWTGYIDQDFFSHYYIGSGITQGYNIYGDFAGNKGPVYYFFYAFLYLIFKESYSVALISASTLIDAFSLFLIFKILQRDWNFKWFSKFIKNILFIIFCILLFKSFTIGTFQGSFYSENLGMLFLLLSIWYLGSKNLIISGFFFSLSVLTRLTYLFFIIYLLTEIYLRYKNPKQFLEFFLGSLIPAGIFSVWFFIKNEFKDFISNVFMFNLNYASTVKEKHTFSILSKFIIESRIGFAFIISIIYLIFECFSKNKRTRKIIIFSLFLSSFLATFVGGIFFFHHFLQFSFFTLIAIASLTKIIKIKIPIISLFLILSFFIFLNYFYYFEINKNNYRLNTQIEKATEKKYMIVMPYYPIYYITYNKFAPDKYYSYFFLSKHRNPGTNDVQRHKNLNKTKLSNTLFLFVKRNEGDEILINEYKRNFEKEFNLVKVNEYTDSASIIEVYESKPMP